MGKTLAPEMTLNLPNDLSRGLGNKEHRRKMPSLDKDGPIREQV